MPDEQILSTQDIGAYLPTTNVWDVSAIYNMDINSEQFKELFVRLYQNVNLIAVNTNLKDTGYYLNQEFLCGQQYFPDSNLTEINANPNPPNRSVYRQVYDFGALPNAATVSILHGITYIPGLSFTRIYGCATYNNGAGALQSFPIPRVHPTDPVEILVDQTKIYISTITDMTIYTQCYIVLEYIKS